MRIGVLHHAITYEYILGDTYACTYAAPFPYSQTHKHERLSLMHVCTYVYICLTQVRDTGLPLKKSMDQDEKIGKTIQICLEKD